jgi:hypothetical protein
MMKAWEAVVFLNRQEDEDGRLAIFSRLRTEGAYQEGDELEAVFTRTVAGETEQDALNTVYAWLNRGSGTFVGDEAYPQRSLSVGDVVVLDGERYSVESVGFKSLTCSNCGADPCYSICPNSPDYYSPEQEREDSFWNESLSQGEYMSLATQEYEREHGEPYVS